jgi:hypothetical protein
MFSTYHLLERKLSNAKENRNRHIKLEWQRYDAPVPTHGDRAL